MADLVITPSDVQIVSADVINSENLAAVGISAGASVALDSSNVWQLADPSASLGTYGIAVNSASAQQPLTVVLTGVVALGAVGLAEGQLYVVSPNAGSIADVADIIAPNAYNILGYANDSNQFVVNRYSVPFVRV